MHAPLGHHILHLSAGLRWRAVVLLFVVALLPTGAILAATPSTWQLTSSLHEARSNHSANLLPNGKVLVAGGRGKAGLITSTAELYDPFRGAWSQAASMTSPRQLHSATVLP